MEPKTNEMIPDAGSAPENVDEQASALDPAETDQPNVGPDGQPIGPDNIRDGTVRGVMGGPNQTQGEGQGG